MTKITLNHDWVALTPPCTFQVISGGRVAVCVGEIPTTNSPYYVINVFDFWNHTNNSLLHVRTLESDYTSDISLALL